jgi:probable F420-dependent oxidoreductase
MKIGIALGLLSPKYWNEVAVTADQLGFHALWMPDHLVFPTDMSGSPFPGNEHPPVPANTKLFDSFAYLCFLAAKTQQIKLGTNVYLLGLRHPFVAARTVQTLDYLSNGRAMVGVGAGWLRQEWEAAGMDPKTRGKRLDEALTICKKLWMQEKISYTGEFYQFNEVMFEPKPVQKPHPPIYIGGESEAALRRVVQHGQGWFGVQHTPESVVTILTQLRKLCAEQGRDFNTLHILTQGLCRSKDEYNRWQDSGISQLVISPWQKGSEAIAGLKHFADTILE